MNKGRLFILSGPSGSGKDTILSKVFEKHPEIAFSISSTSRDMRPGEVQDGKYHFISKAEFEKLIENDMLLEYNCFCDCYYGSPKAPVLEAIERGQDIILEVEVNGAAKVRAAMPDAISIFIMPPSFEVLRERLVNRKTDSPEKIKSRLKTALGEIERADEFDYIVINDDLDTAVEECLSVIFSTRFTVDNRKYIIDEVLNNAKSCNW